MYNMKKHSTSKIFSNRVKSVTEFNGGNCFEVHTAGDKKPVSLVTLNRVTGSTVVINHYHNTIIYGSDDNISIATLDNGYKMVIFNHPAFMSAMLLNPDGIGVLGCSTYASERTNSFGSIDSDYREYHAVKYDGSNTNINNSIKGALDKRVNMSSNSFSLFLDNDDIEDFYKLVEQY